MLAFREEFLVSDVRVRYVVTIRNGIVERRFMFPASTELQLSIKLLLVLTPNSR